MCQRDHEKDCISYRWRYGLLDLNHVVFLDKFHNSPRCLNPVGFFENVCQRDYGKYCINYRSIYGLRGLNHAVILEKVKSGLLDWNHVVFLGKVKTWTSGFELCFLFVENLQ